MPGYGCWSRSACPGWGWWCVCVGLGFSCTPLLLVWVVGRVASCMRPVRFPSPSGGSACRVGLCGGCRGWGLSPPLPYFFGLRAGVCGSWPCLVVALWYPLLPVPVLGLLVSVPPSPFLWVASMVIFFGGPPFLRWGVCRRVRGFLSSAGPLLSAGWAPVFFRGAPWVSPLVLPGWGVCPPLVKWVRGLSVVCLSLAPPLFFFWRVRARGWAGVPPLLCCLFVPFFFCGGGFACSSLCLPWAGARTDRHPVWLTRLLLVVRLAEPCPGPMGGLGYVHAWPGGLSCRVKFWLCRLGGCARGFCEALG